MSDHADVDDLCNALDLSGTVLLDRGRGAHRSGRPILFSRPARVFSVYRAEDIEACLRSVEKCLKEGAHAAGYLSYEAGVHLAGFRPPRHASALPLLWLGIYPSFIVLPRSALVFPDSSCWNAPADLSFSLREDRFKKAVRTIQRHIACGDVYQVNFSGRMAFDHPLKTADLFRALRAAHPTSHSAFINAGDFQIASLSPELFLMRRGDHILTRPMKGTSQRGRWPGEDRALARRLAADEKNRAENVMIVDLMRNDLGRICRFGSVRLRRLFTVERYRSVLQMTSTIDGRLRSDTTLVDILRAVLPAGSVTGAPKKRACEILDGLEMHERGVYCGQIGSFAPNGDFSLNVAIRTIVRRGSRCLLGVGSGIVADSNARQELAETRLKSAFVRSGPDGFRLLETILWRNGRGYIFLDEHVRRMQRSARYFGWQFPEARVRTALESAASGIRNHQARVRLLLSRTNDCTVQVEHLPDDPAFRQSVSRLWLSSQRTDPSDVFLFHKTTQRMLYESELRAARERGFLDALFVNLDGHVTEGAVSNVLVLIDGNWYTPPLSCGLLAGIWRSRILRRAAVHRRRIRLEDLGRASRVIVGNSVRGPIDVDRIESEGSVLFSRNAAGDDIDQFRTA